MRPEEEEELHFFLCYDLSYSRAVIVFPLSSKRTVPLLGPGCKSPAYHDVALSTF